MPANRCPHNNVQQFTEMCLNCGRNIYETDAEYVKHLREKVAAKREQVRAAKLEREAEKLEAELRSLTKDDYPSGW